jgi:hypothetical protein
MAQMVEHLPSKSQFYPFPQKKNSGLFQNKLRLPSYCSTQGLQDLAQTPLQSHLSLPTILPKLPLWSILVLHLTTQLLQHLPQRPLLPLPLLFEAVWFLVSRFPWCKSGSLQLPHGVIMTPLYVIFPLTLTL